MYFPPSAVKKEKRPAAPAPGSMEQSSRYAPETYHFFSPVSLVCWQRPNCICLKTRPFSVAQDVLETMKTQGLDSTLKAQSAFRIEFFLTLLLSPKGIRNKILPNII